MNASSYFTDGEIEIALVLVASMLENEKVLEDLSVEFDAGDRLISLKDKIHFYFNDMKGENTQK